MRSAPARLRSATAVALSLSVSVLAACGGDDDHDADATATATTEAPSPATTAPSDTPDETSASASDAPATTASSGDAPAAGAEWDAIVAAAKEEGSVMYYSNIDPAMMERVGAAFQEAYPEIEFEFSRLPSSADLESAVEAELDTGRGVADVMSIADTAWLSGLAADGKVVSLADLPRTSGDDFADSFIREDSFVLDVAFPQGWGWNTDLLPNGIATAEDFLTPELEGIIGIPEPATPDGIEGYRYMEQSQGLDEFIERLAELDPRIYPDMVTGVELLSAGEIGAMFRVSPVLLDAAKGRGAPVDYIVPENAYVTGIWAAVPTSAPHPNAALVFADFLLSFEANEARGVFPGVLSTVKQLEGGKWAGDYTLSSTADVPAEELEVYRQRFQAAIR